MYRDETETLRAELLEARAEIARLASHARPQRERSEIVWRDDDGSLMGWAHHTLLVTLAASFVLLVLALAAHENGRWIIAIALCAVASLALSGCAWVGWRCIPRRVVKR